MEQSGAVPNDAKLKVVLQYGTNTAMGSPEVKLQARPPSSMLHTLTMCSTLAQSMTMSHYHMFVGGETGEGKGLLSCADERLVSSIAKKVRTLPRHRNLSVTESPSYLYPDQAVGKGKRKCTNIYTFWKWSKKHIGVSLVQLDGTNNSVGEALAEKVYFETSYICLGT